MRYNRLGRCGLKVGAILLGSGDWRMRGMNSTRELMAAAKDRNINYFDSAKSCCEGASKAVMGEPTAPLALARRLLTEKLNIIFIGASPRSVIAATSRPWNSSHA